jgi:TPP-dependent pyruvate/acetoin dehydrogenase alpha subunit
VFHESLNFAVLKGLPVIFICENNLFSVYSPLSVRQPPGREIYRLVQGYGIESHQGDGNDVLEVYRMAHRAVGKARDGGGPTFLEFSTYRWREHCGPSYDNHLGYRAECDFLGWRDRCPLDKFRERLLADEFLSLREMADMESKIHHEMTEAVAFAKESPFPQPDLLLEYVYAP